MGVGGGYWGVGKIYNIGSNAITLEVKSIKELQVVINHFENYPLITRSSLRRTAL
jgi:hypothetical protein